MVARDTFSLWHSSSIKSCLAFAYLKREQIFEISTERAKRQDIRPLEIGILNLMPSAVVERTEFQLLRLLANTPLQIRPTFVYFDEHKSNSKQGHFDAFYKTISEVKARGLDGLIITGANLEEYAFEDVRYWKEFTEFLDWAKRHVTSTILSCWAVHAGLYYHYGIRPQKYAKKKFGIFLHRVHHESGSPLLTGMDDEIYLPHSRRRGSGEPRCEAAQRIGGPHRQQRARCPPHRGAQRPRDIYAGASGIRPL